MIFLTSLSFAKRLIFPKVQKNSSARKSLFGAIICIAVSIIPLITVICVSEGMIYGMTERLISLSSGSLQAVFRKSSEDASNLDSLKDYCEQIKLISGVDSVWPEINIQALAAGKENRSGVFIRGVQNDIFSKNESFYSLIEVLSGSLAEFGEKRKFCVIGEGVSLKLGIKPGETIRFFTTSSENGFIRPKMKSFTVMAVVSSGFQEIDNLWVFIPIEEVFEFSNANTRLCSVMINVENPFAFSLHEIKKECEHIHKGQVKIDTWMNIHSSRLERYSSTRLLLVLIMFLIVLIACVNISSALVMLVMERRREIAILKSIGSSNSFICLSFVMAGIMCACLGIMIGLPIGLLICVNINQIMHGLEVILNGIEHFRAFLFSNGDAANIVLMDKEFYLSRIPLKIPFNQIFLICLCIIFLSVLVSLIPSIKAGKQKPLEIIRNL